jgi:hypothetical protein
VVAEPTVVVPEQTAVAEAPAADTRAVVVRVVELAPVAAARQGVAQVVVELAQPLARPEPARAQNTAAASAPSHYAAHRRRLSGPATGHKPAALPATGLEYR